jgi:ribosomal-protein-alanine N-acetyltransferase
MLRVEPAPLEWLEALAAGDDEFTRRFGLRVAPGWLVFPEILAITIEVLRAGDNGKWGMQLFFEDDVLVGNGGWKGAPVDGVAELGYAVAPEYRNRGIATAVVRTLVQRADASAGVRLVVAHTLAEASPSTSVLTACGFTKVGELTDPDDGDLWRWELPRPPRDAG